MPSAPQLPPSGHCEILPRMGMYPVIPALGRLRQEDRCECQAGLGCVARWQRGSVGKPLSTSVPTLSGGQRTKLVGTPRPCLWGRREKRHSQREPFRHRLDLQMMVANQRGS